jgi:hypothetical protein
VLASPPTSRLFSQAHLVFPKRDLFKVFLCVIEENGKVIERGIEMDEREVRGARFPSYAGGVGRRSVPIRVHRCLRLRPCFVQQVNDTAREVRARCLVRSVGDEREVVIDPEAHARRPMSRLRACSYFEPTDQLASGS